jgi:hypothetical protein
MNNILILTAIICIAALLGTLEFVRYSRSKRIANEQLAAVSRIHKDIHALCAGAINMGKHVDALEQRIRRLAERQDQLELRDPLEQTYAHAIRLAQKGVDVNELVENCGLARGEAELLLRVHRVQQRQATVAD